MSPDPSFSQQTGKSVTIQTSINYTCTFMCTCMYMYFPTRYALLTPETYPHWNGPVQEGIRHLMMSVNMEPDQWQLGKTKVFIKSPESVSLHYLWHSVTNLSLSFSLFHP